MSSHQFKVIEVETGAKSEDLVLQNVLIKLVKKLRKFRIPDFSCYFCDGTVLKLYVGHRSSLRSE